MQLLSLADFAMFAGIALAIFLIILALQKKTKLEADWLLISWLSLITVHLIYFYTSFHELSNDHLLVQTIGSSLPVFYAPLVYLYVRALAHGKLKYTTLLVHLWPIPIYLLGYWYLFSHRFLIPKGFDKIFTSNAPFWTNYLGLGMILINIIYIIMLGRSLNSHRKWVKMNFSFENKLTLHWIQYWIILFIGGAILITTIIFLSDFNKISVSIAFIVISFSLVVQLILIGQYGLKQTSVFTNNKYYQIIKAPSQNDNPASETSQVVKYEKSGLQPKEVQRLKTKLEELMQKEKPHLKEKLSLPDLATIMNIPNYQLSQIINESFNVNFYDFINEYRVEEVKVKIQDPSFSHYTILGIALECGFTSKSSFNKSFKKKTGLTPSEYKKSIYENT